MAETVCACDKEELWTPLLCAQLMWTCDERNSHAFGCTVGQHPLVLLQSHWLNYSNCIQIARMLLKQFIKTLLSSQYKSESVMRCDKEQTLSE